MDTPLIIVPPVTVTTAMLTSSDVPENDYAAWASGSTYAAGERVIVAAEHKIYESLANANTGNTPASSPTWWLDIGATNRWKLLDLRNSSATTQASTMTYVITPGTVINAVAAMNVSASEIVVTLTDALEGVVYTHTENMLGSIGDPDWYAYFFDNLEAKTQLVLTDLPAYGSASLTIEFNATTGNVSCGSLVMGFQRRFGYGIEYGTRVGIRDFSRKETNDFGDTELVERAYSRWAEFPFTITHGEQAALLNLIAKHRAAPLLFIGNTDHESTVVFGFYKDFDVQIAYYKTSEVQLTVEGLT